MSNRRKRKNRTNPARPEAAAEAAPAATRRRDRVYPLDHASPLLRLYAATVDFTVIIVLFIILHMITNGRVAASDAAPQDILLFFGYFIITTGILGQTAGKFAAGIIVVDREGRVPGIPIAIPREMIGKFVSVVTLGIGFVWILYDHERQGIHDKIAGTYVVRKRDAGVPGVLGKILRRDDRAGRK